MRTSSVIGACVLGTVLAGQAAGVSPARYQRGELPPLPALAVGGGEVVLELAVSAEGGVTAVTPLRTTEPFTAPVVEAVRGWRFLPAEQRVEPDQPGDPPSQRPIASNVLVVAVFRPPALIGPTLGGPPHDVAPGSGRIPLPLTMTLPPLPPAAYAPGVVLLEARVDGTGGVTDATVVRSSPPFDDAAVTAVRGWTFRPASAQGMPVSTLVYILLGFPVPVGW